MFWLRLIYTRLYGLLRKNRIEQEMEDEMRFHLLMRTRDNIERGMRPDEAEREARRRFGNVGRIKDLARDIKGGGFMETLLQDMRYGARMLLKHPGFTLIAVITLALGIGANTAIFSVVNAVLLRPLPYEAPERLVMVWNTFQQRGWNRTDPSPLNFVRYQEQNHVFTQMAAFRGWNLTLTGGDEPEQVSCARVSANFFSVLGISPILGRPFGPEEAHPERRTVALLGYGLWERRFGSDPHIVGRILKLDGVSYTIIGVLPPDFQFPKQTELWTPVDFDPRRTSEALGGELKVIARLKPGVSIRQAQAEMSALARSLEQQFPETNSGWGVRLVSLTEELVGPIQSALLIFSGVVGFVLLISCANVANLLLAKASVRQKEMSIRMALGAGRCRLVRQLLTESLLLAILGGALGMLLAFWAIPTMVTGLPSDIIQYVPGLKGIGIDVRGLGFTVCVSLLTGMIFGLAPAWQSSKPNLNESLKDGGQRSTEGRGRHYFQNLFVISEVALALVLLIGAGLMMKSFLRLIKVNPGFNPENVLTAQIALPRSKYTAPDRQSAFFQQLLQRFEHLPGVLSAGAINSLPLGGSGMNSNFSIQGQSISTPGEQPNAGYRLISPNYFRAMGIRLLKGRSFTVQDAQGAPQVAIINETLARRFWPNEDPINKQIKFGVSPTMAIPWRSIIGVVEDVKHWEITTNPEPEIYVPHLQGPPTSSMFLVMRTASPPTSVIGAMKSEVWAADKDQPIGSIRAMEQILSDSIARERLFMLVLGIFSTVAFVLAAIGVYGVINYLVTQRTHEIGVRLALGAQRRDVLKLIIRQGMAPALIGVSLGIAGSFALTRVLSQLLYGVSATDPETFTGISLLIIGVALLASYIPARRASKIDPIVALRNQ